MESAESLREIAGQELSAVEFVTDYLQLRFDGPLLTLYEWPSVLLSEFSVSFGEPGYRDALCAQIGETVEDATLEEGDSLTVRFESGVVLAVSLREEDMAGPEGGVFTASGDPADQIEF